MRRKEKRIESKTDLAYVVPLNYGYADGALYFHSAPEGRKVDILKKNSEVCFTVVSDYELVRGEKACSWTAEYRSVIGTGKARILTEPEEKERGLAVFMGQYSGEDYDFSDIPLNNLIVIRVDIETLMGKSSDTGRRIR